jgi:hypothetical protein
MKRWIAAAVGLFGLVAYVRRRRQPAPPAVDPADELRAKLAESKDEPKAEPEVAPESEVPAEPVDEPAPDAVVDRRQDVHDRARSAMDELG